MTKVIGQIRRNSNRKSAIDGACSSYLQGYPLLHLGYIELQLHLGYTQSPATRATIQLYHATLPPTVILCHLYLIPHLHQYNIRCCGVLVWACYIWLPPWLVNGVHKSQPSLRHLRLNQPIACTPRKLLQLCTVCQSTELPSASTKC